ncbi:MAG: hypothetical protein JHC84_00810 [Solirubrobacteraceae bacterium]|nr:hypothetical protein [Solirubrobacteraceae bacterium]
MSDETERTADPEQPSEEAAATPSRGRLYTARALVVLALLVGTLSIFATWAREQLLNTDQWVKTSTELLENPEINDQIANFLVDSLYENVDVSQQLADRLPPDLQPLAPAAAAAVRQGLDRISDRALEDPRTQNLWADANRVAHEQLVAIILEESSGPVSTTDGVVVLDLRSILTQIGQRIGLPNSVLERIPDSAAEIEIVRSDELKSAQNAAQLLKTGSYFLTFLALGLLILAVWLARGHRHSTMLAAGWALIAAGAIVLLARRIAGQYVVDALTSTASVEGSATAAWDIGTSLLYTLGWQAVIIGLGVVVAAWLAGPARPATAVRRFSAPALQQRPDAVGIGVAVAVILLIAWAPIPALRRPSFVLLLIVLVAIGVYALRRRTQREFPDASGSGLDFSALRGRASDAAGSMRRAAAKIGPSDEPDVPPAPAALPPAIDPSEARIAALERLAALRDAGVLDDEELAAEKDRLLHA